MDLGATPIFEISVKNCKSEPELKFEVENRKLILPQRTCAFEVISCAMLAHKKVSIIIKDVARSENLWERANCI